MHTGHIAQLKRSETAENIPEFVVVGTACQLAGCFHARHAAGVAQAPEMRRKLAIPSTPRPASQGRAWSMVLSWGKNSLPGAGVAGCAEASANELLLRRLLPLLALPLRRESVLRIALPALGLLGVFRSPEALRAAWRELLCWVIHMALQHAASRLQAHGGGGSHRCCGHQGHG